MIVDFHTHVVPPWLKERRGDFLGRDPLFDALYADPKARLATAGDLIKSMDDSGIDISVVLNIGWCDLELCRTTNDYILESAARYPKRLAGFCCVNPAWGEPALRELERCVAGGAKGIGELRPDTQGFGPADVMGPLAALAGQAQLIVLTHSSEPVGHAYPGKGKVTPGVLYQLAQALRDVTVVCAHWGGGLPFYALMPEVSAAMEHVFFDTAATRFLYRPAIYSRVAGVVGAEKILMGSDYPLIGQRRQVDEVLALPEPDEFKAMVTGGNAVRLLFRAAGGQA